ncbi:MAG: ABC transporter ATP-binding protein [Eubacterium sp.]|nr:ABC transporter ATP-binding protein [Eubacterium sp.]
MEAVKFKGISFTYPKSEKPALRDISFSVGKGELCIVMGKSASGKSTLLKLMKEEIAPHGNLEGEIEINGKTGYVAQNVEESIICNKVRAELSFALANEGKREDEIELAVAETASYFNLESKLDYEISSLSGGEKQILNLAAVMIMKPDVLILDEPASRLDPIWAQRFADIIRKMHSDFSTTIIIAEHNADALFDSAESIIILENSKLLIKSDYESVAKYLKDTNNDMLGAIPLRMSLFDGAKTINECSEIFRTKSIKKLDSEDTPKDIALEIKKLYFAYEKGKDILSGLDLKVYKGKINAVLGANSSGKTTLLKAIAGVHKAYRGKIKEQGKISMLSQNAFDLFTKETCGEEVDFNNIAEFLEIEDIENRHPYDLSGGQAQRLALAMVLEQNADIILLDEPTKGFDCVLKEKLSKILKELCAQGKTVLIVTHDIEFISRYCDIASFLSRGRIVVTKPRREFFSSLSFYTSTVASITKTDIVSIDDLKECGAYD